MVLKKANDKYLKKYQSHVEFNSCERRQILNIYIEQLNGTEKRLMISI